MKAKWSPRFAQEVENCFRDAILSLQLQHKIGICGAKHGWIECDCRLAAQIRTLATYMQEWNNR